MGLRQAIATHLEQFRGMHVQPELEFLLEQEPNTYTDF